MTHNEIPLIEPGIVCRAIRDNLNVYLDDELDPPAQELVSAHLDDCVECSEEASLTVRMRGVLRRACSEEAPDSLRLRIQARVSAMRTELEGGS